MANEVSNLEVKEIKLRVRRSILELESDYNKGNCEALEKVMTAWAYIKALQADDPNSFFMIGGFHGEPFDGKGAKSAEWWGGYCNHANVLFPTWHRVYLVRLEKALQSAPGCEDVMLPYWDETDAYSTTYGIPHVLTMEHFTFKNAIPNCLLKQNIEHTGNTIANPLASFTLPVAITDTVTGNGSDYSKPLGYKTVRYPLSGLVGTDEYIQQTNEHNMMFPDYNTNVAILNANILQWLNNKVYYVSDAIFPTPSNPTVNTTPAGVAQAYRSCLNAPNYTVFSNTQSAAYYNNIHTNANIIPLEQPHNDIHLAVGGFNLPLTVPVLEGGGPSNDFSQISGANGDMGENDTAALDPIFYFHHCNVDRVFWLWQKKNGFEDKFEIISEPEDPGTKNGYNGANGQGPANGQGDNEALNMQTELKPFYKSKDVYYTSYDCINIEKDLKYSYSEGSLSSLEPLSIANVVEPNSIKKLQIPPINRAGIQGSFIVSAFATVNKIKYLIGYQSVLSRWKVEGCANCQVSLNVFNKISLHNYTDKHIDNFKDFHVEISGRESQNNKVFKKFRAMAALNKPYPL